jgi:hypothetical protein
LLGLLPTLYTPHISVLGNFFVSRVELLDLWRSPD